MQHIVLLFKRLLIVYAAFFLCRLLFLTFNFNHFTHEPYWKIVQSFMAGLVFDTSAIAYLFSLFIVMHLIPISVRNAKWYQVFMKLYFVFMLFVCLLLNLVDTGYYPFSGKRSGMEIFMVKADITDQIFSYLKSYWYLLFVLVLLIWLAYKFYPELKRDNHHVVTIGTVTIELLVMIFIVACTFLGARGGWNLKPVSTFDAARLADVKLVNLTLNTPFQLVRSAFREGLAEQYYMSDEEAKRYFNPVYIQQNDSISSRLKPNIVLIIVESLGKEYVGYYNNGKGYTTFLDSLMQYSVVYMHAYANGKRSIEGLPAIIASMPSIMSTDYINSPYQANRLRGIGDYLQEIGYDASFYHGGKNGTMNFNNFVAITNSGDYFGLNEYPDKEKDYDGNWGIYDEPYLQYFAQKLNTKSQPFFSTVFTLSSHHPYNIPPDKQSMFADGILPIHKSIRYADYALQRFFETARKMSWYQNTIFIITADHSADNITPYYQTQHGRYAVPMIIFGERLRKPHHRESTVQHADILPEIINTVYPNNNFSFSNVGKEGRAAFAIQYVDDIYQLIQWPWVYQFDGNTGVALYNIQSDSLMQKNIINSVQPCEQQLQMDKLVKSYIQQYHHALIHNKTYIAND